MNEQAPSVEQRFVESTPATLGSWSRQDTTWMLGLFGTAIGALFVGVLLQGLTMMNVPYYTQDFVKGAVLVVALVFTFALLDRRR